MPKQMTKQEWWNYLMGTTTLGCINLQKTEQEKPVPDESVLMVMNDVIEIKKKNLKKVFDDSEIQLREPYKPT